MQTNQTKGNLIRADFLLLLAGIWDLRLMFIFSRKGIKAGKLYTQTY